MAGPLALACHALPQTEAVAKLWWRALAGCLVIQVAQAIALAVAVRLYFAPGNTILGHPNPSQLETLLSGICLFWVLWKIPSWTVQVILRGTPASSPQTPGAVRMLRSIAIALLLRRFLAAGRAGAGRAAARGGFSALPREASVLLGRLCLPAQALAGGHDQERPEGVLPDRRCRPRPSDTARARRRGPGAGTSPSSPSAGGEAVPAGSDPAEQPSVSLQWGTPRRHRPEAPLTAPADPHSARQSPPGLSKGSTSGPAQLRAAPSTGGQAGNRPPGTPPAPPSLSSPDTGRGPRSSPTAFSTQRGTSASLNAQGPAAPRTTTTAPPPFGHCHPCRGRPALRPVPMRLALEPARTTYPTPFSTR